MKAMGGAKNPPLLGKEPMMKNSIEPGGGGSCL